MQQTRLQRGSINCQRERRRHHYKHETPTARDCLVLLLISDEKRKGWLLLVTVMIEIANLVNKLKNVMFSKTRTKCMYSNSAARARSASVQSSKREQILC